MKHLIYIILFFVELLPLSLLSQDFTQYVNPMIGTGANGHVFPGACLPFGMVQLSPDQQTQGWAYCSGYHYEYSDSILGFSHTHLSGTGVGDLGDILIMPYIGVKADHLAYPGKTNFLHSQEKSSPGYYEVFLPASKINARLTSSQKVGVHEYTFPQSDEAFIHINLKHKLYGDWGNVVESEFVKENDSTFSGYRYVSGAWAPERRIYFVITSSKPSKNLFINTKDWDVLNGLAKTGIKKIRKSNINAVLQFDTKAYEKIILKVAISAISVANARKNMDEVKGKDFSQVLNSAKASWNQYLSRINIEAEPKTKEIFYTSLYHTLLQPNQMADSDSSFFGPDYQVHKSKTGNFYSTMSLWDTYRAAHPLYTILVPELVPDMMNTLLQHNDYNGYLPIWTLWGTENHCMIANHAVPVLTDAILKGFQNIDIEKAYAAIKKTLTEEHQNSHWNAWEYDKYAYMRADFTGESSVSKTLEFSFNDWCAAQIAKKLNKMEDYNYFIKRSQNYKNHYNPEKRLFWPKNTDGSWQKFNEYTAKHGGPYTEGNSWQYIWAVQHDPYQLIKLFPNSTSCVSKLDSTFSNNYVEKDNAADVSGLIGQYAHGNEPSHHTAYMYNFLGQPWKTQKMVRQIMETLYTNKNDGLCGNEDCGQMSAWYALSALGFYPFNPANGVYVLGSPVVKKAIIQVGEGKTFTIIAKNNNAKKIYVASTILNGKPYLNTYIRHSDISKGGTLEFIMSDKPLKKETLMANRPPVE